MARPRFELTDDHIRQIEQLAGVGLTLPKIAAIIGISEGTLRGRKRQEKRVFDALERGKAKAEGVIGRSLFERAREGDVAAIRWWEMTRAGRTEESRQQVDHSGLPPAKIVIKGGK